MALSLKGRALHWTFKTADRKETARFCREILGMKPLRHEEFPEACAATSNGPYNTRWSRTMVGYGLEDTHFVLELVYNYGIRSYDLGSDLIGITIRSSEVLERAKEHNWPIEEHNILVAPGGYVFHIIDDEQPKFKDPVEKITLSSSNIKKSIAYWNGILGLTIFEKKAKTVSLGFNENDAKLELHDIGEAVERKTAFGRIAFSVPYNQQGDIGEVITKTHNTILTPLMSLDTPQKASIWVTVLADPDGHEILFVDDESFRELSQIDPYASKLLDQCIKEDKTTDSANPTALNSQTSNIESTANKSTTEHSHKSKRKSVSNANKATESTAENSHTNNKKSESTTNKATDSTTDHSHGGNKNT